MTVIATLGDVPILVLQNDFDSLEFNSSYGYAQIPKLSSKPTLQNVGDPLSKIRLEFSFLSALIDPIEQVQVFREAAEAKEDLPLVFGSLYKGRWVITKLKESPREVYVESGPRLILFTMDLIESVAPQPRNQAQSPLVNPFEFIA